MDGDVAPLTELVELARRHRVRLVVDEAHGVGCLGPGGRGAVHEAGLEHEVDVVVGTLGKALGAYGAYVTCDGDVGALPGEHARDRSSSRRPRPRPRWRARSLRSSCLPRSRAASSDSGATRATLRDELAREGFDVSASTTQIVPLIIGEADQAMRICETAIERGVFAQAIRPPTVPDGTSRLRLAVMATHSREELREAARVLGRAALQAGFRPSAGEPVATARDRSAPRQRAAA